MAAFFSTTQDRLPSTGNVGDVYHATDTRITYVCIGNGGLVPIDQVLAGVAGGQVGPPGATGPQGSTGQQGMQGLMGLTGLTGATGPAGSQGPAGANGTGFNFRTAFDNTASYAVNDVVT